ncbi:hypothetical protein H8356DRAFT_378739 [Neocallimastix lanati (nom. inval.)]|nr:hypothetical protein H8356DRAFT_378739 [Neocallimastix sp. JGI-2020a]
MESNVKTKVYKLTDRMDKYHSSYTSSKYSSYAHSSINENKSKSRNSPHESESTTYKRYLNSHDVPQTTQTHRDSGHRHHSTTTTTNNVHNLNNRTTNNNATNNNNDELINSMYNHSTALIANATVFPKSRIQDISTREYLNIKSYFEKHILKNPKGIAEKRSSLLISDISSLEGHTNTFVLPRLKIDEFIDSKQVSENVVNISMKWPLEKSGYILRKNIYTKESNNNLNNSNPSVINKIKHSNFLKKDRSSSIKGKLQEHSISPSSSKWLIFYVEIRGPYIFFYQLIRKKPVSTSKPTNSLKPRHSVMNKMSIENLRKNLVEKPLSRILSISKSSASRRQVKMIEASQSSTTQTTDDDNFIPTYPTNLNQHHHHASLICTVNDISGPLEILSAKKVLVHYIPLYYSIITPVITDNNPNILALSTIQGIDLKEDEPKYLLDQMLIEISNIGVSHVHSFIEETSIVVNKSFNLTSLMETEVQNWQNSLKQGSFIHSDDDLFESINFVSEHKNVNVIDHYESRHVTVPSPLTENPTEDLYTDLKNYTFPHVSKKESSSSSTSSKEKKEKGKDKIKSIHNQYTQKFFNYCKQIDDTASYHSSSSSNNSISSSHKRSENNLNEVFLEKRDNTSSPNVFKNRPKAYSISSENPFAKKTTSGNIIEKTKTRKPSIDTEIHLEDGKKLNNTDGNSNNNNNNLLSPSRYYRKYSMPEFINNFSSFSNSKYLKSSSSSIKSTSSANKIESNTINKKSNDIYEINREYKLESSKSSNNNSNNNNNNNNNKKSSELRDIMHVSSPTESKRVSPATVNVTDVTPKFAKTSLAKSTARTATNYLSEITHRYKNAEPPTPVNDRYKNIDLNLESSAVDAQVPTPSLFINNNMINLDEITDQANELINAGSGSGSGNNNKKAKKEKKSKKSKDKVKKNLISAPVLLAHDGANGSSLPGQVGNKVLSISTRPLNVVSKELKSYSNPALIDYASNPTKENRNKLMMNATSPSVTTTTATASATISTIGMSTGVGTTAISTASVITSTPTVTPIPTSPSSSTATSSVQVPKKSENLKSKFYSPFINAITKSNHKSLYSSSPTKSSGSKMNLSLNTKLLKTNSKDSLRSNKNTISSPTVISKSIKLGSGYEEKKTTTEAIRSKSINTNTGITKDITKGLNTGIGTSTNTNTNTNTNINTNTSTSKSKNRNVGIDDIDEGLKLDLKNNLKYEEKLNRYFDGDPTDTLSSKKEEVTFKNKERPISPLNINTSFYIKSFNTKSNALNRFSFPSTVTENLPEIPILLQKCVELVEKIGLRTEGIYRLSGNSATVQSLRKKFELDPFKVNLISPTYKEDYKEKDKDSVDRAHRRYSHAKSKSTTSIPLEFSSIESPNNLYDNDIHVVTGCIKSYLRDGIGEDHVPVCTYDLYQEFINASQIKDYRERMIKFQDIVHLLPGLNFVTLRFICQHLYRVSLYSTINRMTIKNLAIIFGPTLLKPLPVIESAQRLIEDMKRQCEAVEILIENHEFLFGKIEYEEVTDSEDKGSIVDYDKKAVAKVQEYIDNNITYESRRPVPSSKYMLSSSPKVTSPITPNTPPITPTTPTKSITFRSPTLSSSPLSSSTKHFLGSGSGSNNNMNIVGNPKSSSSIKYSRDLFEKKSSPQTMSSKATPTSNSSTTVTTTTATTTVMTPTTSSPTSSYKLYLDKKSLNTSPSISYKLYSEKKTYNTTSKSTTTYKPYSITTNFGSSSDNSSNNKHENRPSTPTKYAARPSTPTKYDKHDIRPSTPTNHSIMSTSMEPINLNLEKSIFDSLKFNTSTSEELSPKLTRKSYDNYKDSSSPKLTRKSYDDYKDSSSPKLTRKSYDDYKDSSSPKSSSINKHKGHDESDETLVTKNLILNIMKEDKTSVNDIGSKYLRTNTKLTYSGDEKNTNIRKTSKVILPSEDSLVKPPRISSKLSSALDDVKPLRTMNKFNSPDYKPLPISKISNTGSSSLRKEMNRPTLPPKSSNEFINKKHNISSPSTNTNTNKSNTITSSTSSTEITSGSLSNEKDVEVIYLSNAKTSHSNNNHLFDELFDQRPLEKMEKTKDILLPSIIIPSLTGQEDGLKTHLDLTNGSNGLEDDILSPTKDYNKTHLDLTNGSNDLEDDILSPSKDYNKTHLDLSNDLDDDILSPTKDYNKTHLDLTDHSDKLEDEIEIITLTKDYKKIHVDIPDSHINIHGNGNDNANEFENKNEILSSTKDYDKTHLDLTNRSDISFDMDKDFTTIISNEKNTIDDSVRYTSIVVPGESKLDEPLLKFGKEKENKHRKELSLGQDFKTDLELGSLSSEINKEFNNISHRHHADDDLYDNEPVNEPDNEPLVKKSESSININNNKLNNININSNPSVEEIKITLQQQQQQQPVEEVKEEIKAIEQPIVVVTAEETVEEEPTEEVKEEIIEQPVVAIEETIEEQPAEEVKEEIIEQSAVVEETIEEQPTEESRKK